MEQLFLHAPFVVLVGTFILALIILTKSADVLTDQAVLFAHKIGISDVVIGATVVSLGTSLPEFATSVMALFSDGNSLALGNALGSVVTNLSLILGIGVLYGSIPVMRRSAYPVLWACGGLVLLFVVGISLHGELPRWLGILFLSVLPLYFYRSLRQNAGKDGKAIYQSSQPVSTGLLFAKVVAAAVIVAISSAFLVATVQVSAARLGVSEALISATIVALGTSLPELSSVIASTRKGYGGLAFGNLVGASLMNIFFVLGTTITFAKGTLVIPPALLTFHFPVALLLFAYLLYNIFHSKKKVLSKKSGVLLIMVYAVYLLYHLL